MGNHQRSPEVLAELAALRQRVADLEAQLAAGQQDHRLLQTLLDHLPASIFVKDRQSRFLFNNHESQRRLGVQSQAELDGKTDFDFLPPEQADEIFALEQQIMETGEPLLDHPYYVHNALGWRWLVNSKIPLYDAAGACVGLVGISRDVTERESLAGALSASEERYRLISELSSDYVYQGRADPQAGYVETLWASGAFERITGYTVEEINALPNGWGDVVLPEDRGDIQRHLSQLALRPVTLEYRITTKQGELRWIRDHFRLTQDAQGVIHSIGAASDITQQKAVEARLRQLSQAVEQSPVSIVITDLDGKIEYANPRFGEVTGYTLEESLGQNPSILKTGHTSQQEYKALWETIAAGGTWQGEFLNRRKNGETYWELAWISAARDARGEITHYIGIKEEITQRKQAEEALRISEARHRALFEHARDVIILEDEHERILEANPAAVELLGYSLEELRTMYTYQLQTPESFPPDAPMRTGPRFDTICRHKDGTTIPMEITLAPLEEGGRKLYLGIGRDMTERLAMERALRDSEEYFRWLWSITFEGIIIHDHGQVVDINPAILAMSGYTREVLIGQTIFDFLSPATRQTAREMAALDFQRPYEVELVRADGSLLAVEALGKTILLGGRNVRAVAVRDLTDRREIEQQRLAVVLERERVGLLSGFIRDVSHEFRTPLSVVGNNLYLLSRQLSDEVRTSYLEPIYLQVDHIHKLVEAMLTLSQLDSGTTLRLRSIELDSLLHDLTVSLQPRLDAARLTLRSELWPALAPVQADVEMLFQALNNVMDNACNSTPPGGQITLRTQAEGEWVDISISDTGSGISPEDLPHIFQRFYRGDKARSTRGAGLGLSIAAKVVEKHGGHIKATSKPGQGTTITIRLPLARNPQ